MHSPQSATQNPPDMLHPVLHRLSSRASVRCPAQVLVIDRRNGPAHTLVDTASLLLDRDVSVVVVDNHADALHALEFFCFDLVVVGLEDRQPLQLTVLPEVQMVCPALPILAVGHDLPLLYRQYARKHGACEVLNLPRRASDLKTLIAHLAVRYLAAPDAVACG